MSGEFLLLILRSNKPRGEIPYFLKTIGNTEVYPGMAAKFTACVGGFPEPEFEWFRNQRDKIFGTDRVKLERDGAGSGLLRLIIKDVDIGDLGDYTLRIWNEHGDAECSAYLKYDCKFIAIFVEIWIYTNLIMVDFVYLQLLLT
jgi:hypothetical protein